MIELMVSIMCFFMACFGVIMFFSACLIGLAVLDYIFDIDIKESLKKEFGPKDWIKRLRKKLEQIADRFDEPSKEDLAILPIDNSKNNELEKLGKMVRDKIEENPMEGKLVLAGFAKEKAEEIYWLLKNENVFDVKFVADAQDQYIVSYKRIM